MNVTQVSSKKPGLDHAKLSQSPLAHGRWSDALNAASAARDSARTQHVDANHAKLTPAQKAALHHELNGKGGVAARTHHAVGEGHVNHAKPATTKATSRPAAIDEKRIRPTPDAHELEQKAQTLVNQFFMGSMLKQMRESPFKTETFSGGKAGEAYAGMFDSHIAEHAGNRLAKSLVRSMVRQYRKNATPAAGITA